MNAKMSCRFPHAQLNCQTKRENGAAVTRLFVSVSVRQNGGVAAISTHPGCESENLSSVLKE